MKEIGEFLKTSRINNGVSIEEAADDLNLSVTQLENIEEGNIKAFKDLYVLKDLVKDYGKYLGVQTDSILDEFNDFMFEHTSKISLKDILEAEKKANEQVPKQMHSPYTKIRKKKANIKGILIFAGAVLIVIILLVILMQLLKPKAPVINQELKGEMNYEFTY